MIRSLFLAASLAAFLPVAANAQNGSRIAPPSRADQEAPRQRPGAPALKSPVQPAATPKVTPFVLKGVTISGSTLPPSALEAAWRPFIGQTLDAAGIQTLSDALGHVYATSDIAIYSVVIPDQDLRSGQLSVKVLEGRVEAVRMDKARLGRAAPLAMAVSDRLTDQAPLHKSRLQRNISLLRDIPGLQTTMQLLTGSTDDGVVIKIDPEFHPVQFGLAINNRGTYLLGKTQVQADLYLNSAFRSGDQTKVTYAAPTEHRLFSYVAVAHSTPIGVDGTSLLATGSYLTTRPAGTAITGHAASFGAQVSRPVIHDFERNLYLTLGVDGADADNALLGSTFSDDRSRAVRLAAAYDLSRPKSAFAVVGSVSQGINGAGARTSSPGFTELAFTKADVRASYNRALGEHVAFRLKAAAQATGDALPGSEQFSLGGADYGRAYEAAVVSGDTGYAASAELAWVPPALDEAVLKGVLKGSEIYGFVDAGHATFLARPGVAAFDFNLASAGAGVRLAVGGKAVVEMEAARAFDNSNAYLQRGGWRGVVSLRTLF